MSGWLFSGLLGWILLSVAASLIVARAIALAHPLPPTSPAQPAEPAAAPLEGRPAPEDARHAY